MEKEIKQESDKKQISEEKLKNVAGGSYLQGLADGNNTFASGGEYKVGASDYCIDVYNYDPSSEPQTKLNEHNGST